MVMIMIMVMVIRDSITSISIVLNAITDSIRNPLMMILNEREQGIRRFRIVEMKCDNIGLPKSFVPLSGRNQRL
jgi:glycerol-3-phosphate O-acyltransferase